MKAEDFRRLYKPKVLTITTRCFTKASRSWGPFEGGLERQRTMRVMLHFDKDQSLLEKYNITADYWKLPAWGKRVGASPLIEGPNGALYLRFHILEVLEESFWHLDEEIPESEARKYLPPAKQSDKPVYCCVMLENVHAKE